LARCSTTFLAADRLHPHLAGQLERNAQAVTTHEALCRHWQTEYAVSLRSSEPWIGVREALELVPEPPACDNHLPHLAILEVLARQVAQVAHEPQRAFFCVAARRVGSIRISTRPDHLLVHRQGAR